jgi:hypothetical protein
MALGCSRGVSPRTETQGVGAVRLSLTVPGGKTLSSAAYEIRAASGAVVALGTIDVRDPNATVAFEVGVPAGAGYVLSMSATTDDGTACAGTSAPFDVVAGGSVGVQVPIQCGSGTSPPPSGSVIAQATLDSCPMITSSMASPLVTSALRGTVDVSVTATDPDPGDVLTYRWQALPLPGGQFADPTAPSTQYTCDLPGTITISVTVIDNHTALCFATRSFTVTCGVAHPTTTLCAAGDACCTCEETGLVQCFANPPTSAASRGCDAFTGQDRTNCLNLLRCIRGQGPNGGCGGFPPLDTYCICGLLEPSVCAQQGPPVYAPCQTEYLAAAGGSLSQALTDFVDPTTPVGMADTLLACDFYNGCVGPCGVNTQIGVPGGVGGAGGGGGGGGAGGAPPPPACAPGDGCCACETSHPEVDYCDPGFLAVPGATSWGCDGFTGQAAANCRALLACFQRTGCVNPDGDDPTPCLCGALSPQDCEGLGTPADAPCAAEYAAAAGNSPNSVFVQFFDPTTPVGIADNLAVCDSGAMCGASTCLR